MKNFAALSLIHRYPLWFFGSAFALLCATELFVSQQLGRLPDAQIVAIGMTIDLVLGIPLLGYFLLVQIKKVSPLVLVPLFFTSVFLAQTMIPTSQQYIISALYQLFPAIELGVVSYGLINLRRIIKEFRRLRHEGLEAVGAMDGALACAFDNRIVRSIILTECLIAYFALGGGRHQVSEESFTQYYTNYRRNGYGALLGVMLFCMGIEIAVVHLLVQMWLPSLAWVLTILSIFSAFWLWGDYSAIKRLPIILTPHFIHFRLGVRWSAVISRATIARIRRISRKELAVLQQQYNRESLKLSITGEANYLVVLKHAVVFQGLYGRTKSVEVLFVSIDDESSFIKALP